MCGRYVLTADPADVAAELGVERIDASVAAVTGPDYNIAPRQAVLIVRERVHEDTPRERVLSAVRWGLVPAWADDPRVGDRMINARAETASTSGAFATAFRKRRCIVVADGFYEWKRVHPRGPKQPVYFAPRDGRTLAFAGLWAAWRDPAATTDDPWLRSCLILTTDANEVVAPVHDRMPAILEPSEWDRWLDPLVRRPDELQPLLHPAAPALLEATLVGTAVNSADNNGPGLIESIPGPLPT